MENANTPVLSSDVYQKILLELNHPAFTKENPIKHYPNSNKVAVIVDPRFDETMEGVIRNFMFFMNPNEWNLMIISYSGHEKKIKEKFPHCTFYALDNRFITFDKNGVANIPISYYNRIFLSNDFWNIVPGEHVCIFQKDCIMYKMFEDYFYQIYDFAGANYHVLDQTFHIGGINGGFSLRKKSVMQECIKLITKEKINEYKANKKAEMIRWVNDPAHPSIQANEKIYAPISVNPEDNLNEDIFFTYGCEMLLKQIPDKVHRVYLAIECDLSPFAAVYHGWTKNYHDVRFAVDRLMNSPLFKNFIKVQSLDEKGTPIPESAAPATINQRIDSVSNRLSSMNQQSPISNEPMGFRNTLTNHFSTADPSTTTYQTYMNKPVLNSPATPRGLFPKATNPM
jgi:hypothetical protein